MSPSNRAVFTVLTMLLVAPCVAVTALICLDPGRWGGAQAVAAIPFMVVLGVLTKPVLLTYIPAIVVVPILMHWIAGTQSFASAKLPWLLFLSLLAGGVAGAGVLGPAALLSSRDASGLALGWLAAGAISGAVSLAIICLLHRYGRRTA